MTMGPVIGLVRLDRCFCRHFNFVTVRFDRHSKILLLYSSEEYLLGHDSCQLTMSTDIGSLNAGLESKDYRVITVKLEQIHRVQTISDLLTHSGFLVASSLSSSPGTVFSP